MDHLVQFTISVDDAHIAQMVEKEAAKAMKDEVLKVCKSYIGCERNYWGDNEPGPALKKAIDNFMNENREEIIEKAADKLAERLSRTKVVKEAAARRVSEEVTESGTTESPSIEAKDLKLSGQSSARCTTR